MAQTPNRRDFIKSSSLATAAGISMPYWFSSPSAFAQSTSANERLTVGCIGTGSRWNAVGPSAFKFADCVALCDVDANHLEEAKTKTAGIQSKKGQDTAGEIKTYENYKDLLDQDGIDIVTVVTPDHWHTKPVIDALRAGKDIYAEKPLTLTIHEGKQINKVLAESGRVMQVGTQQRTEMSRRFLQAIALIRQGRIGDVRKVTCNIGGSSDSGEIPVVDVPTGLNWDMWLGQAPEAPYRWKESGRWGNTNGHYEFRWWYEYSGGKMTDWGAHHVDIASWALGLNGEGQGPISVEGLEAVHPCEYKDGYPVAKDRYNAAVSFDIKVMFAPTDWAKEGVELHIVSNSQDGNGILFEGTEGRFHVSRGAMKGKPVEDLKTNPLPEGALEEIYGSDLPGSHMENFINCVSSRKQPISDVPSHVRAMDTLHLANIAIRLGRKIEWDPKAGQIVGDEQARGFQKREARSGYEIDVEV